MEKKTFDQCRREIAKKLNDGNKTMFWNPLKFYRMVAELYADQEKKAYALSCIEASLIKAAENAEVVQCDTEYNYQTGRRDPVYDVDRDSIKSKDNHVLL